MLLADVHPQGNVNISGHGEELVKNDEQGDRKARNLLSSTHSGPSQSNSQLWSFPIMSVCVTVTTHSLPVSARVSGESRVDVRDGAGQFVALTTEYKVPAHPPGQVPSHP